MRGSSSTPTASVSSNKRPPRPRPAPNASSAGGASADGDAPEAGIELTETQSNKRKTPEDAAEDDTEVTEPQGKKCTSDVWKHKAVDNPLPAVRVDGGPLPDLPHRIIMDILIRLPAECVLRCQNASKLLDFLATTPFFVREHLARHSTSIVALHSNSRSSNRKLKFCFIDEQTKKVTEAKLKLDLSYSLFDYPVMLYDSYDGFLLFKNKEGSPSSIFVIWNPTTKEQVTITPKGCDVTVCGFYFNPHKKEYEVLLLHRDLRDGNSENNTFYILSFGSKLLRNIGRYSYFPSSERPPTIINGTLYWMVDSVTSDFENPEFTCANSIMSFNIGANKFSTMQHCGASCDNPDRFHNQHDDMQLIKMEGQLCLCLTKDAYSENAKVVLWVLINPSTNSWVNTHTLTLPKPCTPKGFSCWPNSLDVEVVKMKDGKLLVRQKNRLLLWDLDLNTHKVVETKEFENDSFRPAIHIHSLVSLNSDKFIRLHSKKGQIFVH